MELFLVLLVVFGFLGIFPATFIYVAVRGRKRCSLCGDRLANGDGAFAPLNIDGKVAHRACGQAVRQQRIEQNTI
jgi:hypothetical protein